jgi:hypothetical protein
MANGSGGGHTYSCLAWTSSFWKAGMYKCYKITVLALGQNSDWCFKEKMCAVLIQFISVFVRLHLVTVYHFFAPISTVCENYSILPQNVPENIDKVCRCILLQFQPHGLDSMAFFRLRRVSRKWQCCLSRVFLESIPLSDGADISLSAVPSAGAHLLVFHILQVSTHSTEDKASNSEWRGLNRDYVVELKLVRLQRVHCIKGFTGKVKGWGSLMDVHDCNTDRGSASNEPIPT